ncbi:large-associated 5 isoform X29 [Octopus vulgaris]|uniref:Large-associated 5 isoform X29 n=1 Tax=Octopus vulgaris TaxID=6645 RepID=A0AA36BD27_OCTVU|nr:large-associated 5 isoform X29 [Octopus vulgaris]
MSSHQTAYKCTERIDPKIKRRLRRSQEWQNKRDEMVNRRRKIGVMSPCTEFDLSLNSPVLENALTKTSSGKENKKIIRDNKKQEKCNERLKMLQKWKEEKELQRKQAALEKAKCRPFVVTVSRQPAKSAFDMKWEQKLQKKQVKTTVPVAEPPRKTRAATATTRSTTTATTTAATRATTRATTRQADVAHKPKTSSLVLPEKKGPTKRQPARLTAASESKKVPLTTQTRVTRQTNNSKAATRATTRTLPSTKAKTTSSVTQKQAKSKIESPVKGKSKPATTNNFDTLSSKVTTRSERESVSFVPGNFVFTAPENLQSYNFSTSLSPNSTQNFFFSGFDEPPTNNFGRVSDSPTKNGEAKDEETSPNRSGMVEESEAPEKEDQKSLVATTSTESPFTPVRNSADVAVFKTPVSSISLKSKRNRQSSSDSKPNSKKKPRKSSSCPKMDSVKVPQSPEEWVELLKNSPMIEMTRRKIPKHQLDKVPTLSLEDDDAKRAALKEGSTTSDGQRAVETVDQEAPVMESQGEVTSGTQEIEGSVTQEAAAAVTEQIAEVVTQVAPAEAHTQETPAETVTQVAPAETVTQETPAETVTQVAPAETVTQVAPVETVTQVAPAEADTQETPAEAVTQVAPAETVTQETPAEAVTQVAPAEAVTQVAPAETVTQVAPAETVTQVAPAETVTQVAPTEADTQETPAVVVPQDAAETLTLETPVMEPQEMKETVAQGEVIDVPQEVAEIATQDASGIATQEAPATTLEETVEAVSQESAGQVLQESSSDDSSQPNSETEKSDTENVEHNVPYFRNLVVSQTEILNNLSDVWEVVVPTLSEEVEGDVRTVIGQAKLLISQRFHQFIGLVDNCEFNTGEKTTTCEDLQGFWDMVDFQVEDVKKKFADLQKLKDNNWQAEDVPLTKPVKKIKKAKPVTSKISKAKGKSKFAQFMAQKKKIANNSTGGDADEAEKEESVKVFDGHFFKVESPVRSPKPHCLDSPRSPVVMPVFTETTQERSADIQADIHEKDDSDDKTFQTVEIEPKDKETVQNSFDSAKVTPLVSRRSYVPTVPSPLLQDITPVRKRASTNRRSRLLGETVNTPDNCQTVLSSASVENVEKENDEVFVLQSPPRRRSQRVSRRLSAMESFPKSPSKDSTNTKDCVPVGQLVDLSEHASLNCESTTEKKTPATKRRSRGGLTPGAQSGSRRSTRIARLSVFHVEPCSTKVENHADMNLIDFQTPMTSKRKSMKRPKSVAFADSVTEEEENCSTPAGDLTTVLYPISPNVDCTETIEQSSKKQPRFGKLKVGYTPIRSRQNRRSSQQMEEDN